MPWKCQRVPLPRLVAEKNCGRGRAGSESAVILALRSHAVLPKVACVHTVSGAGWVGGGGGDAGNV